MVNTDLSIEFGGITKANIEQLRLINASTLPVRYSDKFYGDLVTIGDPRFLKFAIFNGFTVGAVCARVESISDDPENPIKKLYIMTLNVLPSYRRRGIASKLLDHILKVAKLESDIIEIYLHVQVFIGSCVLNSTIIYLLIDFK